MELQITKTEAKSRLKEKITSIFGIPILLYGIAMMVCRIVYIFNQNPDLKFEWGEISTAILLGYALFSAKDTLITGMTGLLLPKKK